jgi:hypothetical protein
MTAHVDAWAFRNAGDDVRLLIRGYDHQPDPDAAGHDTCLGPHEDDDRTELRRHTFEAWRDALCQPGVIRVMPVS